MCVFESVDESMVVWSELGQFLSFRVLLEVKKTEDCYLVSCCVAYNEDDDDDAKKNKKNRRQNTRRKKGIETQPKWTDRVP